MLSRNKSTKRIFQKRIHETNPQNESLKKDLRNESTKRIFWNQYGFANPKPRIHKDSFPAIVLRIRKDSWGFVGFVKTGQIFEKSVYETNPRNESFENIKDLWSTIWNKSFWSQDSWSRYKTNPWIRKTNPGFYESLIRFPHPYKFAFLLFANPFQILCYSI